MDEQSSDPQGGEPQQYDVGCGVVPGMLRRIRRRADLAQRDLAREMGVSQSTVARWETGETSPRADLLVEMARRAGLRVALLDAEGVVVPGMQDVAGRDRGGRRYPAHVDPRPGGHWMPRGSSTTVAGLRDRMHSREFGILAVHYRRRGWRRTVDRLLHGEPPDHPVDAELVVPPRGAASPRVER